MISTEVYAKIRQYKKKGFSMRKAAELLSISRNTIKRYWDGAHTPDEKKAYPATLESPQKEKVMAALQKYYQENQTIGKQRINARTAWETIRETHNVGNLPFADMLGNSKARTQKDLSPCLSIRGK